MFTQGFQLILVVGCILFVAALGIYAIYCRRMANSFIGTGRMTDVETWSLKATLTGIATFVVAAAMAMLYVLN